MMEAACTSETSVNFYQATRLNTPEDSHLQSSLASIKRYALKICLQFIPTRLEPYFIFIKVGLSAKRHLET
jgi:hypothetical protein